jgi:hypothetical protein
VIPVIGLFIVSPAPHTPCFFVRNVCIGGESWHVNGLPATFAGQGAAYDFDPTTLPKISGKTPANNKAATAFSGWRRAF